MNKLNKNTKRKAFAEIIIAAVAAGTIVVATMAITGAAGVAIAYDMYHGPTYVGVYPGPGMRPRPHWRLWRRHRRPHRRHRHNGGRRPSRRGR